MSRDYPLVAAVYGGLNLWAVLLQNCVRPEPQQGLDHTRYKQQCSLTDSVVPQLNHFGRVFIFRCSNSLWPSSPDMSVDT
jgi:hypothetical protein